MKLLTIKNFKKISPQTPEQSALAQDHGVTYLQSDDGQDWYECQARFRSDTMKLCFDKNNIIRMITSAESGNDVSSLWPDDMSVTEIKDTPRNRRADITGGWLFIDGKVVKRVLTDAERLEQAIERQRKSLQLATEQIAPLQDALDLDIATEEEMQTLREWKKYRVLLSRLDLSALPVIWPQHPAQA